MFIHYRGDVKLVALNVSITVSGDPSRHADRTHSAPAFVHWGSFAADTEKSSSIWPVSARKLHHWKRGGVYRSHASSYAAAVDRDALEPRRGPDPRDPADGAGA